MCGIGGILRTDGEPIPEEWLDAIDARIAYRGPDGAGRFRDRVEFTDEKGEKRVVEVALVHRRLSIIDHADGGQPMVSDRGRNESDGLVAVVFNGCIYNHRELRQELEAKGHTFTTDHSDTEVLIHGWREWKEKLPEHLEGMYAFAVWDRESRTLALSRDWFGEKPLYYDFHPASANPQHDRLHVVTFASNADSHCKHSELRSPDSNTVARILKRGYQTAEYAATTETELGPGICIWFPEPGRCWRDSRNRLIDSMDLMIQRTGQGRLDRTDCRRLMAESSEPSPPAPLPEGQGGGPDAQCPMPDASRIESLLDQAVAQRLEADVPLGCFLSGGVDSSLIAHFAKRHKPDLMTFSVRMPDPRYDESPHAEAVANHLGTDHRTLDVSMNPAEDLVHLIDLLGQPFGDSSILPTYWVSKAARQHVKVALSGDGGDELFIGYERYMAAPFLASHWWWLRFLPASPLHRAHPKSRRNKLARLVGMAREYPKLGIAAMESVFTQDQITALLNVTPAQAGVQRTTEDGRGMLDPRRRGYGAIAALRNFDIDNYLPGDLLRKVDTASMAVALEVRCPFLDRDLARAVLAMPVRDLIPGGQRKGLLRRIARQHLPADVVDRPKMGFAIPIGEWFRSDFGGMKTLLLDHLNSAEPFGPINLNRAAVQRLIDEHMEAGPGVSRGRDHSHRLFTLLTLSIWAKSAGTG